MDPGSLIWVIPVQEVDGVPVAKEMGVDVSLQVGPEGRCLDELVCSLLRDVATLAGREQVVIALQGHLLSIEEECAYQTVLYKDEPLHTPLPEDPNPVSAHIS